MHLQSPDWIIVATVLLFFTGIAIWSSRHAKGVTGFLVSGRCAGRYLLTIAAGGVLIDAINIIAMFELFFIGGFPTMAWGLMIQPPLAVFMAVSGWAAYRFRETQAMTMPQYLEMRYSSGVRVSAGIVAWVAGMINFGIYPAVSAHFVICFCGLPSAFTFGGLLLPTFPVLMAVLMAMTLVFVFYGGHITVLVLDFCQGVFINVSAILLILLLAFTWLNWGEVMEVLRQAPPEASLLDPAHTSNVKDFNVWYFVISTFGMFYTRLSSLERQSFDAAALTPHEGRMGATLAQLRWHTLCLFFMIMVLAAQVALKHPSHATLAQSINAWLDVLEGEHGKAVRGQMTVSTALAFILPVGWKGLFLSAMIAAMLSSKSAFLHSFGSTFVQDVVMPFRKTPLEPAQHMRWLRLAMLGVTAFSIAFGCIYRQTENILMFFALSSTLWLAGSGALLLGGLYWRKGNSAGAYAAMITGFGVGLAGFIFIQLWQKWYGHAPRLALGAHGVEFNPQWSLLLAMLSSIAAYMVVSLVTGRGRSFDLNKLLHRDSRNVLHIDKASKPLWKRIFGITPDFTTRDRITVGIFFGWISAWFVACVTLIGLSAAGTIGDAVWGSFWKAYLISLFGLLLITTIWLGLGGVGDLRTMFRMLSASKEDTSDDGTVVHDACESFTGAQAPDRKDNARSA